MVSEVVDDNTGVQKSILKGVVNDSVVFIVSPVAFTPSTTETNAAALRTAGFTSVSKGVQLSTAISSNKFQGTASDADGLGAVIASSYLKSNTNDTTSGSLGILNDSGLTIGA